MNDIRYFPDTFYSEMTEFVDLYKEKQTFKSVGGNHILNYESLSDRLLENIELKDIIISK